MSEYRTHSFNKDWHDKVERFLEEHPDLAFDSPKYFIKFCVNKYMDEAADSSNLDLEYIKKLFSLIDEQDGNLDKDSFKDLVNEADEKMKE